MYEDSCSKQSCAFTIVAHNYIPLARVLGRSFAANHPEIDFYIVVVDHPTRTRLLSSEHFTFVAITDIDFGSEGFEMMATIYDVMEFSTSVKPFALRHFLKRYECALYFDPDIRLYDRVDPLIDATHKMGISLTPHCLKPIIRDGLGTTEFDIMQAGIYNLGYIGVSRNADRFLDWWSERLRRDAISDPSNHLFTDQRWIDLAIPIFNPHIESSPAYNVAYWNIDQRQLSLAGSKYLVSGEPLRFFHFSGFDPAQPFWLSKHQPESTRVSIVDSSALSQITSDYATEVLDERGAIPSVPAYGWGEVFPGLPLDNHLRRLVRFELKASDESGHDRPPSPFSKDGARQFVNWLTSPIPADPRGMPRVLSRIFDLRIDLREAFPEVSDGELGRFAFWVDNFGVREYPSLRFTCPRWRPSTSPRVTDIGRGAEGVDVVGYFSAEMGVGEAGRLLVHGLRAAAIDVSTINCDRNASRQKYDFPTENAAKHKTIILSVNADQIPNTVSHYGKELFKERYVIGQWFWELEEFPPFFDSAFNFVDEVWTPTKFIAEGIRKRAPKDVHVRTLPLPLLAPKVVPGATKAYFGLQDRFLFLYTLDFLSVVNRKNPSGVIRAFKKAFRPNEGPILVLKTINGNKRKRQFERLKWEARDRSDVIFMDSYLDPVDNATLISCADCYVSLHRSEGLGLTMAEAMTLGKPVIATNYSGNVDFMTSTNSLLVPFTRVRVGPDSHPYPASSTWAEPDLHEAALFMRKLVEDEQLRKEIGHRAQVDLANSFNASKTGAQMREALLSISSQEVGACGH
jgi:glycosyltransferase involved in cell wall biosynthesis